MTKLLKSIPVLLVFCSLLWLSSEQKEGEAAFALLQGPWAGTSANYHVNNNFPASAGSPAHVLTSLQQGADAWNSQACSNFQFNYQGPTSVASFANDGINSIYWTPLNGGPTIAQTNITLVSTAGGPFYISHFDMRFFGNHDHAWTATNSTEFDIQGIATHEFGHAAGLDHSTLSPNSDATMNASVSAGTHSFEIRSLEQEDIDGINFLYGQAAPCPPSAQFLEGSFEASAAGGLPGAPWLVTGGATNHVVRPDGGAASDNGFPTDGSQWCDLNAEGLNAVGISQTFVFDPALPVLSFDAAFINGESGPQTTYNDFMRVEISDGSTTEVLYYADTNTPTPNSSLVHSRPMTEITSRRVILSDLFSGTSSNTQFTVQAVVSNAGDPGIPSFGYLDNFKLSSTTIVLEDGMTHVEDFEEDRGGYNVHFGVWEYGVPANSFITGAASGTKAWVTGLSSDYPNNANARLVSPRIDCTALTSDPVISFKQIFEIEGFYDVVRLEMSIDNGVYFPVGAQGNAGNWYTQGPGGNHGVGWDGTSGAAGDWRSAGHVLEGAAGHVVTLLFRLRTDVSVVREGMGIDDIVLSTDLGGQAPRPGVATLDMLSPSFGPAVRSSSGTGVELGLPGPYEITAQAGVDWLNVYFNGTPNDPILFLVGPLNIGAATFSGASGNQIDIGTAPTFGDVEILGNGNDPGLFSALFHLNSSGTQSISFGTVPVGLAGYQAGVQAFYLGSIFKATNAIELTIQ